MLVRHVDQPRQCRQGRGRARHAAVAFGSAILATGYRMLNQADARMRAEFLSASEVDAAASGEVADEFGGAPDATDLERESERGRHHAIRP